MNKINKINKMNKMNKIDTSLIEWISVIYV